MRVELSSQPVKVSYREDGGNPAWAAVTSVGPLPVPLTVGRAGLTDLAAAFEASQRIFQEWVGDEAKELRVHQATPKLERRSGYSLLDSPICYQILLGFRGETRKGRGVHSVGAAAFVIALFEAFNKLLESGIMSPRELHEIERRGIR